MTFQRIAILGVGLIGGSVGLACRRAFDGVDLLGFSDRIEDLDLAIERGAIGAIASDLAAAISNADLIILCTPVGTFEDLMTRVALSVKPGAIITDVGSTKRSIVASANRILPNDVHFVGSHPMAGGEKQGMQNARADLLENALCIITPDGATNAEAITQVELFWQALKLRTMRMSPERHDQLAADISHLPHAIAAALVGMQLPDAMQIAARGFADMTRIAGGDIRLWSDIFLDNRDNLTAALKRFQSQLEALSDKLDNADDEGVRGWLQGMSVHRSGKLNGY